MSPSFSRMVAAPAILVANAFLKTELIPEVEARYRADSSRRILFGQSRGGYMVLYSAFTEPVLFWGRIASNPTFDPGRDRFFSPAAPATRSDLGLVVTSGSRDFPELLESALAWFQTWQNRNDAPWAQKAVTIEGGTHAADSPNSYRLAIGVYLGLLVLIARFPEASQSTKFLLLALVSVGFFGLVWLTFARRG